MPTKRPSRRDVARGLAGLVPSALAGVVLAVRRPRYAKRYTVRPIGHGDTANYRREELGLTHSGSFVTTFENGDAKMRPEPFAVDESATRRCFWAR